MGLVEKKILTYRIYTISLNAINTLKTHFSNNETIIINLPAYPWSSKDGLHGTLSFYPVRVSSHCA